MKSIKIDHITKIEGHAKLHLKIDNFQVKKVDLSIYEGSRFFEGILKNKNYDDISHISSRICGVCSVVHSLTSLKAIENAFKLQTSEQTNQLRELLNISGIIQSHVLHLYFLALPDYLGYKNAMELAVKRKKEIKTALKLKQLGNQIVDIVGGRDVHPIAATVGGFSRLPSKENLNLILKNLKESLKPAEETLDLFYSLKAPKYQKESNYFALSGNNYFYSDKLISCIGKGCILARDYDHYFKVFFKENSTSEFVTRNNESYRVGALARICVNKSLLSNKTKKYVDKVLKNKFSPSMNNLAQAIEIYEGILRCIEILKDLKLKNEPLPKIYPIKSTGVGATEAPRGILFHKYSFNEKGFCTKADIITPTSQNLQNIEDNIKTYLPLILNKKKEEIILEIEKLIRSYDPCISCSTHFLEVKGL